MGGPDADGWLFWACATGVLRQTTRNTSRKIISLERCNPPNSVRLRMAPPFTEAPDSQSGENSAGKLPALGPPTRSVGEGQPSGTIWYTLLHRMSLFASAVLVLAWRTRT